MPSVTNYLGPEEINAYQTRANQADTMYQRGLSQLAYQRSIASLDHGTNMARLGRRNDNVLRSLPSAYVRRNVMRSGILQRGLDNFAYDRQQSEYDQNLLNSRRMDQFKQTGDNLDLVRQLTLQQIEAEKGARQASLAAAIQGVQ